MLRVVFGTALVGMLLIAGPAEAGKKKKKKGPAGPKVGWQQEAGWSASCWVPPDFSALAAGPKRMAWQETRDAIVGQWRGNRSDGMGLDEKHAEDLETVLLSKPERIEAVAAENLEKCKAAVGGDGTDDWSRWLVSVAKRLTEGECPFAPMDYTVFNYLSVNAAWQSSVSVCKNDKILVHGTDGDYYQLSKGGPWMNAAGDASLPLGPELPCNMEGCKRGQLVLRFTSEDHQQQIIPIGIQTEFYVPAHGRIELMINDDSLDDNVYKIENRLEHHMGIEIKPAGG